MPHNKKFQEMLDKANSQLEMLRQFGVLDQYFHEVEYFKDDGVVAVSPDGTELLNLAGYSYLGLSQSKEISNAVSDAVLELGNGTYGSRVVAGTNSYHIRVENKLAEIHGKESACVFNSGSATNQATVSILVGKGGIAIIDELGHTSLFDGVRLAKGAKSVRFAHNDPKDLDLKIQEALKEDKNILVMCEGVYSMDGDIAPIPDIVSVCKKHNVPLMVDEAHSFGSIGENGRGVVEHFGLSDDDITIKMGTLGKAIPGCGGYIAASAEITDAVRSRGNSFVFSAALPAHVMAGNLKALEIIEDVRDRISYLHKVSSEMRDTLNNVGLGTGDSSTCIIPVMVGDELACYGYAAKCREKGLWAVPITWPAVPFGEARLRISLSASFTQKDLDRTAAALIEAAHECSII